MAKKHSIEVKNALGTLSGEYKEGEYVKFPYINLNIVVYKPGKCPVPGYSKQKQYFADAVITIGKAANKPITVIGYDDLPLIKESIDFAIDVLNAEGTNLINPAKVTNLSQYV